MRNFFRFVDAFDSSDRDCIRCISLFTRLQWIAVMTNNTQFAKTWRPAEKVKGISLLNKGKHCCSDEIFHCFRYKPAGNKKNKKWFRQFIWSEKLHFNYFSMTAIYILFKMVRKKPHQQRNRNFLQLLDSIHRVKVLSFQNTV